MDDVGEQALPELNVVHFLDDSDDEVQILEDSDDESCMMVD